MGRRELGYNLAERGAIFPVGLLDDIREMISKLGSLLKPPSFPEHAVLVQDTI